MNLIYMRDRMSIVARGRATLTQFSFIDGDRTLRQSEQTRENKQHEVGRARASTLVSRDEVGIKAVCPQLVVRELPVPVLVHLLLLQQGHLREGEARVAE
jgi:hypothetical protein